MKIIYGVLEKDDKEDVDDQYLESED